MVAGWQESMVDESNTVPFFSCSLRFGSPGESWGFSAPPRKPYSLPSRPAQKPARTPCLPNPTGGHALGPVMATRLEKQQSAASAINFKGFPSKLVASRYTINSEPSHSSARYDPAKTARRFPAATTPDFGAMACPSGKPPSKSRPFTFRYIMRYIFLRGQQEGSAHVFRHIDSIFSAGGETGPPATLGGGGGQEAAFFFGRRISRAGPWAPGGPRYA